MSDLVSMVWTWEDNGGPRTAEVHPDEVGNFLKAGWKLAEGEEMPVSRLRITVDTPEIKALLDEAAQIITALKGELAAKDDRIAELEALLEKATEANTGAPEAFDWKTCQDLEKLKAFAISKEIPLHHKAGLETVRTKIAEALETK
jgi:hypothetical protein